MEALEDSNCHSMSDSFSLYERYLRTFNVVDTFLDQNNRPSASECETQTVRHLIINENTQESGNVDLSKNVLRTDDFGSLYLSGNEELLAVNTAAKSNIVDDRSFSSKNHFPTALLDSASLLENSSITEESNLTDRSEPIDIPVSSEDSKSSFTKHPKPVIITSLITMENSNNAVDSVPLFRDVRPSENVFKLPITELTFNGTLKHVQKLKPIVDPLSALTSGMASQAEIIEAPCLEASSGSCSELDIVELSDSNHTKSSDTEDKIEAQRIEEATQNTGDSQYEEFPRKDTLPEEGNSCKWNSEQSYSSLECSFDSGVRSPDMFSEDDKEIEPEPVCFWDFLKDYEAYDKRKVRKMEETLQGVLPPPSVTILKTDVTEMLKKYFSNLPTFNEDSNTTNSTSTTATTPTKLTAFVKIPTNIQPIEDEISGIEKLNTSNSQFIERSSRCSTSKECKADSDGNTSVGEPKVALEMCSEIEAKDTMWPEVVKCRFFDVHYNVTKYSEQMEMLAQKCGERFVGAETDSTVTVYSGGMQSPNSATKRKALRLKMAQAKSPGRRLSHLARRRQAFCSAATIGEKAHTSTSKMVLIDKNFFPHRKLITTSEKRSPRFRRTPGKRTPGKKTPSKTPKTKSGGSSKKKAMRRLLMDPDTLTRSQPTRESLKRALFVSPENRKVLAPSSTTSVPLQAMKSKRALFGSPDRTAESKSCDGSQSDIFLKRKRLLSDDNDSRSKIAKSLSFGGDTIGSQGGSALSRRASEMFANRSIMADLDEHHRKKLLWAVSEALRIHGWRMQSPGFREKASSLARLTRRLLTLPPHAARLAAPKLSTSETMLKIARQYVFAIIQGRSVEDCFEEEKAKLANESNNKVTGYISASAYQQIKNKPTTSSQIKENIEGVKHEIQRNGSKNILQDKLLNIDSNSNSSIGISMLDKAGLFKSHSMPSFEEAAKMRARRQISFDNVDFPKR